MAAAVGCKNVENVALSVNVNKIPTKSDFLELREACQVEDLAT